MKAINNPLPNMLNIEAVRGRSALKAIARKRLRAAERHFFRRVTLGEMHGLKLEVEAQARLREQTLKRQAKHDMQQLIAGIVQDLPQLQAAQAWHEAHLRIRGRVFVEQTVLICARGGASRPREALVRASCAI